jgi:predicted DNA-binding transcriptional regulator AlpA
MSTDLLDKAAVCRMLGGTKALNTSTLYRNIRKGLFPKPIHVAGSSRWLRDEVEAVLRKLEEARS